MIGSYDFAVVGAGIFGVTTAISLARQKYSVVLINPDSIPHPLAASTDISKVVRMEYGSDLLYMDMAIASMDVWRRWNKTLGQTVYHEVGYLLLSEAPLTEGDSYEAMSYQNLLRRGFKPERIGSEDIRKRFPMFNGEEYVDAMFHDKGGYAESGKVVTLLARKAAELGVKVLQETEVTGIEMTKHRVTGVLTKDGRAISAGGVVVCAGNFTPYLVPDLQQFMRVTGHPVFHLSPLQPATLLSPKLVVFGAGISSSGWYGFPLHPTEGVLKIAHHGEGLLLDPRSDQRVVSTAEIGRLREFIDRRMPGLKGSEIVYTRRCCYTDTLDGHFWIDRHPEIEGLTIGAGGSGHGFKMAPVIGDLISSAALGTQHRWSARFRWRNLQPGTANQEEARSSQSTAT